MHSGVNLVLTLGEVTANGERGLRPIVHLRRRGGGGSVWGCAPSEDRTCIPKLQIMQFGEYFGQKCVNLIKIKAF